jgi:uncharacterized protein YjbI with pentapeptide repeats
MHKSFREYLLAEYYIESILHNKIYYLNVGIPTPETIFYLEGLLELLQYNESEVTKRYVENFFIESVIPQNAQYEHTQSSIIDLLIQSTSRFYEDEKIIFQTSVTGEQNGWKIAELSYAKLPGITIHRWLSLYILNKLAPDIFNKINKLNLANFISQSSHGAPHPLRLSKADLSGQNLSQADLSYTNLTGANLSNAILARADLRDADLTGADLHGSKLYGIKLSRADLTKANLTGADLSRADLTKANLTGADLSRADLYDANLNSANLTNAIMTGAYLEMADLRDADLTGADLTGANLNWVKKNENTKIDNKVYNISS